MNATTTRSRCERTRVWAALAPDGELAALERRLLDAHLSHCAGCRAFAEDVATVAAELRAAAAERAGRRLVVHAAPVRRSAGRLRAVASVTAVAAMALGVAARTPFVEERDRPQLTQRAAPADVVRAELHTLRLLRQEAQRGAIGSPGTPSGAFGNQPA